VGSLLGPRGAIIQNIRNVSKANVSISEHADKNGHRVVTIAGSPQAAQHAMHLIQQRLSAQGAGLTM
jgi:hypothetical protein